MDSVTLFGIRVDCFTTESLNGRILQCARDGEHAVIANVNVHALNIAARNSEFAGFLHDADHVFCDGHGVMVAARVLGGRIPEKITYAEWLPKLAAFCAGNELSIYLLGGQPGGAEKAATELKQKAPELNVCGTHHGYFDMNPDSEDNRAVIEEINRSAPNILIVCFGMPRQENWLRENWSGLRANVALTGGAAFDYMAGTLKRPPAWLTDNGLEWLGRMLIEPSRLWRRYTLGNMVFGIRLAREWLTRKKRS